MESSEIENTSNGAYNEMICVDYVSADGHPLCQDPDQQRVSMFTVREGPSPQHYRLAAVGLGLLSVILLVVDIALGVQYNRVREGNLPLDQAGSQLTQLREIYSIEVQALVDTRARLRSETHQMQRTSNMLEEYRRSNRDTLSRLTNRQEERTTLLSRVTELEASCVHCMPGWELLDSLCYYIPTRDARQVSWQDGRNKCLEQGADLAVIDTGEKQRLLGEAINARQAGGAMHMSGYWFGLHDRAEEGRWKWLNGTELTENYWNDGEPNDEFGEDCAAIYPGRDQRKSWNDAPCGHPLKWICEIKPRN